MAKSYKLHKISSLEGTPFKVPKYDEHGSMVMKSSTEPDYTEATLVDILDTLIKLFPREKLTMDNVTHGAGLKERMREASKTELVLEEEDYKWVKKMLEDDAIGPKIFGFSLPNILEALEDYTRPPNDRGKKAPEEEKEEE